MANSEYETSASPEDQKPAEADQQTAQRAADDLKTQIAALRSQVRQAQADLRGGVKAKREPRTFNDKA